MWFEESSSDSKRIWSGLTRVFDGKTSSGSAKVNEVVWTSGAADDYLGFETTAAFEAGLSAALELLRQFPEQGPMVPHSNILRRLLVGKHRQIGLYYAVCGSRIVVTALVDLKRDPSEIVELLHTRLPE